MSEQAHGNVVSMTSEQGNQRRPIWTLTEAAERCQVSRSTIRRYREQARFPNAFKDPRSGWMVPLTDLLAAGLNPAAPPAHDEPNAPLTEHAHASIEHAQEVAQLRATLEIERAHRQAVEQIASERLTALDDLRTALRMIEAAKPSPIPAGLPAPIVTERARRPFWSFRKG